MLPITTLEKFEWLTEEISERMQTTGTVAQLRPDDVEVFLVTTSWLETELRYAKGILTLLTGDLSEAVGPIERAAWELWINFRYLLLSADRKMAAAKVLLAAKATALDFMERQQGVRPSTLADLRTGLAVLAGSYPEAFAEVTSQREKRKFHWSGTSYSAMERAVSPDPVMYTLLSWDAHSTIGLLRDVKIVVEADRATVTFGRSQSDPLGNSARVAYLAGEVLYSMFDDWRQLWGLPALGESPA